MRLCLKCYLPCDVQETTSEELADYGDRLVTYTLVHEVSACCGNDYRDTEGFYQCSACGRWCGLRWGCCDGYQVPASSCCRADVNTVGDIPSPRETLRAKVERVA